MASVCLMIFALLGAASALRSTRLYMSKSYMDELGGFRQAEKRVLVGFSTDAWNIGKSQSIQYSAVFCYLTQLLTQHTLFFRIGQRKYKDFLAVYKMAKKIQKMNIACVEVPVFEIAQGMYFFE